MRALVIAFAWVAATSLAGCGQTNSAATLTITPSGTVTVTGPTEFTAELVNSTAAVTWSVAGGATLSSTSGLHVSYVPPPGTVTGTLTATAGDLTASVQVVSGPGVMTGKTIPHLTAPVTVTYDAQDIPHIQCATMVDCIAVQGYLQARDRLFEMDFLRHVARGKVSELIGVNGLAQDVQLRTLFTTRAGNRLEDELAAALDPTSLAIETAFVGGINAYLTELQATAGAQLPGEYAQLPFPLTPADISPWEIRDSMALARLQQFQLSETLTEEMAFDQFKTFWNAKDSARVDAWIRAAAPPTEQAHTLSAVASHSARLPASRKTAAVDRSNKWQGAIRAATARAVALRQWLLPADATVGSNNWVVSAAKSASHVAMVANDPHLSLQYPPLFHLAVLTSTNPDDHLNLAGGAFPGIPGALVGRGAHVGWGVTVVGYDVTDVYKEQFAAPNQCPTAMPCVVFKGGLVSLVASPPQSFRVRMGPGAQFVEGRTLSATVPTAILVVPHHGPLIQSPDAGGKALSFRWTGHEGNTQDTKAFLGLNTAVDVDAAVLALKDFSTGAQNFVLADDQGNIAYDPHALVPKRDHFTDITTDKPWFPVPGDGSAEWGDGTSDCASPTGVPASCWIADADLPYGRDPQKGYYFTANADPTAGGVTDDNNPLAHPPYLSFSWSDSTGFRATRIEQLLAAAIAAHGSVSLEDMQAIQADHVSRPGMLFTPYVAQLPVDPTSPPELATAKAMLAQWAANGWDCPSGLLGSDPRLSPIDPTPTVVQNSSGCFLFHEFLRSLFSNVFADDLKAAGQDVNGLQAMKATIFMLGLGAAAPPPAASTRFCDDVDAQGNLVTPHTCSAQVVKALVQAVDTLVAQVGPTPSDWVWGRVHTIQPVSLLALVTTGYEPGPYARPGGAFTVDVGSPAATGNNLSFAYGSGGNVRHISLMDPSKPVVKMQLPGPERDGPTNLVGPDLLGQWVKNTYFDFAFGDQIAGAAVAIQTFKAP